MIVSLLFIWVTLLVCSTQGACNSSIPYAVIPQGYCASIWTTNLGAPREIRVASNNDVLVLDQASSRILVLWEAGGSVQQAVLVTQTGLNHAIFIQSSYLYASDATTVYRWKYTPGDRSNLGASEIIINSIPCCHHTTRSLEFDSAGLLYVESGSGSNVDPNSSHSQIRRFIIPAQVPAGGLNWTIGELFADGVRNEVGIRFDSNGQLWGVENGLDDLYRADLGGDIHQNNPSEEMNLFKQPGLFYGYPYCWSEFNLPLNNSHPIGTNWVHPNFMNDGIHSDEWCQTLKNVVPPIYNFQAHMAPMDIIFYEGSNFPQVNKGDAFVSFHGSWDRTVTVGYKVSLVSFENGFPVKDVDFFSFSGPGATGPNWPYRPVGLAWYNTGLLIGSDSTGSIIFITPE